MIFIIKKAWRIFRQNILKAISVVNGKIFVPSFNKFLIIAPHPDDEILGCGGLIATAAAQGKRVEIIFITDGEASHKGCCTVPSGQIGAARRSCAMQANNILGIKSENLYFLCWPDGSIPMEGHGDFLKLTERIAVIIKKTKPDVIFCPHPFEGWPDHVAAEQLTRAALKILKHERMPHLYYYCVWFWFSMPLKQSLNINWQHAHLLNIATHYPHKRRAMQIYLDAMAPCNNPWVGKLPSQFLRAFDWHKELFFEFTTKQYQTIINMHV